MPNAGYPDDDDSRTASGDHDLGRQRVSLSDVCATTIASNVAEQTMGTRVNNRTDSLGDQRVPWPAAVDGRADSHGGYQIAAENPASAGTDGTG